MIDKCLTLKPSTGTLHVLTNPIAAQLYVRLLPYFDEDANALLM